jgi:hypothetical protein
MMEERGLTKAWQSLEHAWGGFDPDPAYSTHSNGIATTYSGSTISCRRTLPGRPAWHGLLLWQRSGHTCAKSLSRGSASPGLLVGGQALLWSLTPAGRTEPTGGEALVLHQLGIYVLAVTVIASRILLTRDLFNPPSVTGS